ncbi:MAG: hypothetical protein JSU07_08655 [Bacteroidetes bacterium]|nr:hypothetical protein [Bacteroidota bacterium]
MRKFLSFLVVAVLFFITNIKAQTTVFSQDFNTCTGNALPAGWSGDIDGQWQTVDNSSGIPTCTLVSSSGGTCLATGDGTSNSNLAVTTKTFATLGFSNLVLTWNAIRFDASVPTMSLQFSTNNFATYTNITFTDVAPNNTWAPVTVNIPAAFNAQSMVSFRWIYDGASTGNYYAIDDVFLKGSNSPTFYYNGVGQLDQTSSWGTNTNGSGANPPNFTTNGQTFNLVNASTVNFSNMAGASLTIGGTSTKFIVGNGTTINATIPASKALVLGSSTQFSVSANASVIFINATLPTTIAANFTLAPSSTIEYAQTSTLNLVTTTYGNLTISGGAYKAQTANITVAGALNLNGASSDLKMSTSSLNNLTLNGTITGSGKILTSNSGLIIGGSGAFGTLNFGTGNTVQSIGRLTLNRASAGLITLGSNLTINTTLSFTKGSFALNGNALLINANAITLPTSNANGNFRGTRTSTLTIAGSGAITNNLFFNAAGTNNYMGDLILNRGGATLTMGNAVNIWGSITPSVGTIAAGSNYVIINSDNTSKGRVGIVSSGNLSGTAIVKEYYPAGKTGWVNLCSGGVNGNTFANWNNSFAITCPSCPITSAGGNAFTSVYTYDQSLGAVNNAADPAKYVALTGLSQAVNSTQGYWVYLGNGTTNTSAMTLSLSGAVNVGNIGSVPLALTGAVNSQNGWNLVANPYPAPIVASQITGTSFNNASMIVYDPNTDSNIPVSGSAVIAMGQAFQVQATSSSGANLTPSESWKSVATSNQAIYKTTNASNYYFNDFLLDITSSAVPTNFFTQAYFTFGNSFTANYDIGSDVPSLPGQSAATPRFFSNVNSMELLRNSLPMPNGTTIVPLLLKTGYAGIYNINPVNLNQLPAGACVTLVDVANNITHDLKTGSYSANVSANASIPQFELHITLINNSLTSSSKNTTCTKSTDARIVAKGNGTGPWNYTWKDNNSNVIKTTNSIATADTLKNIGIGTYKVDVNTVGTCDNANANILVQSNTPLPTSMFSTSTNSVIANSNVPVTFYNSSSGASNYVWSYDDGSTDNTYNATHVFNDAGTYNVKLTAINSCNDSVSYTNPIYVIEAVSGIASNNVLDGMFYASKDNTGTFVKFNFNANTKVEISATNVLGQVVVKSYATNVTNDKIYFNFLENEKVILITIKANSTSKTIKIMN